MCLRWFDPPKQKLAVCYTDNNETDVSFFYGERATATSF